VPGRQVSYGDLSGSTRRSIKMKSLKDYVRYFENRIAVSRDSILSIDKKFQQPILMLFILRQSAKD
jgi:hypothetical protein